MKVSRVEWLLILIGVGLLLVFPALYYQTKGFPTYQDWQELAPPQTVHIINGTVSQDSQSPYYVTFQQIEFSAVDKLSYDFSTGGPCRQILPRRLDHCALQCDSGRNSAHRNGISRHGSSVFCLVAQRAFSRELHPECQTRNILPQYAVLRSIPRIWRPALPSRDS